MIQEQALKILSASLINLQKRKGKLTVEQVEAEVINLSCLEILKNEQLDKVDEIVSSFVKSAKMLVPQYDDSKATIVRFGVFQNVQWDGMWEFLKNYFISNHGFNIDGKEDSAESKIFYSTRHIRYEQNIAVANTPADRTVDLFFTEERRIINVNIQPTLSAKKGFLTEKLKGKLVYAGSDPDYRFTVVFDDIDEVDKFILEMPNRNLRIEYFE